MRRYPKVAWKRALAKKVTWWQAAEILSLSDRSCGWRGSERWRRRSSLCGLSPRDQPEVCGAERRARARLWAGGAAGSTEDFTMRGVTMVVSMSRRQSMPLRTYPRGCLQNHSGATSRRASR